MAASFFPISETPTAKTVAEWVDGVVARGDGGRTVKSVSTLDAASSSDLSFLENKSYVSQFETSKAGVCLARKEFVDRAPEQMTVIACASPYNALGAVLTKLYPDAVRPFQKPSSHNEGSFVHASARLDDGVVVAAGASIAEEVQIGRDTIIGSNASICSGVTIGRGCQIGPNVSIQCSHIGDNVIIHAGTAIGQDGFGFAMGPTGHKKIPQIGRVIIQNDVEIGSNTTIDRGALRDTVIGEGTKIDNLVQIAHNVQIGRHCVIVAQTGISGSARLGDFVALGGQVGVVGHISIGDGAQIAATSNVKDDVPPGSVWGGTPAKPIRQWFREVTALSKLAAQQSKKT
ncbi:MAG: UDP-3-O-(3-hydroxymyristoyl)glucosamine N-acyltransferase [Pseudomonadota bacterium]